MNMQLYNDDCLSVFNDLQDESIDLFITDCPYKITAEGITLEEIKNI